MLLESQEVLSMLDNTHTYSYAQGYCTIYGLLYNYLVSNKTVEFSKGVNALKFIPLHIMNKAIIAEKVHEMLGGTKTQAEKAVDMVVDSIIDGLKGGDEVSIAGLGIFSTKMRAARQGRNPRTGESIQIQAMRIPKFRAAKALKDAVK